MSHMAYFCNLAHCWGKPDLFEDCKGCKHLSFSERVPDVYRPHRRAVVQSLKIHHERGWGNGYRVVVREARLGCPAARAWARRHRRVANQTYLGRWSWSWLTRGHKIPDEIPLGRVHILSGRV